MKNLLTAKHTKVAKKVFFRGLRILSGRGPAGQSRTERSLIFLGFFTRIPLTPMIRSIVRNALSRKRLQPLDGGRTQADFFGQARGARTETARNTRPRQLSLSSCRLPARCSHGVGTGGAGNRTILFEQSSGSRYPIDGSRIRAKKGLEIRRKSMPARTLETLILMCHNRARKLDSWR